MRMRIGATTVVAALPALLLALGVNLATAQESSDAQNLTFGGPDAVENQLRDDAAVDRPTLFERWFEWKDGLIEKHGFSFSVDYSAVGLGANESPGEDRKSVV